MNIPKNNKLEKIYTPKALTLEMLDILEEFFTEPITEFLEPAAGDGAIIDVLREVYPDTPIKAVDIYNESKRDDIYEMDFFKTKIPHKKGRVTIMNPPFSKGIKFIEKALELSDYVISITGANSFINIGHLEPQIDRIHIHKKYKFNDGRGYDICVIALREKKI